ncbi:MAG: monovalent cation/H+ antiporter subunit A [Paracoccus denitrificans]|nr:MAG: monovalent cation/H+ antiporter subunit A [Paracoccus denitrificans]PZO83002.1 MAG: monovalent cation/H+ antiporter subunit A [Paracoccus denitrificans]
MSLIMIAFLPFLGALVASVLARSGRGAVGLGCGTVTAAALIGLCLHIPAILGGDAVVASITWMPQIGLNATFRLDGLSLLFGILILGIGLLIIVYASNYLRRDEGIGRFFTILMLFQGAMTGLVLTDNILMLLIFWELTSLSSFLLIGFNSHTDSGRRGASMALTVTGLGGLAMIAGLLLLARATGSYEISGIIQAGSAFRESPVYLPALTLILLGAFTKSAQFPFHFWLPRAMAAPTPVSAYLHSATMVKAGLFLMAKLWPVLSGTPEWTTIVTTVGLVTMLIGAVIALFQDDMKGLLAYSTVSHLGLITMLLGLGTEAAAAAAMLHIIAHATFKAALFMSAGIVDHETHIRAISRLGGLRRLMPLTFVIALLSSLSMAGIPPFAGFLSKEAMLTQVADSHRIALIGLVLIATIFSVAYSLRFFTGVFLRSARSKMDHAAHDPGPGLWVAPAIMAGLTLLIGLLPGPTVGWLVDAATSTVVGQSQHVHLALWHGLNTALMLSVAAIALGLALVWALVPAERLRARLPRIDAGRVYGWLVEGATRIAGRVSDRITNGGMSRALGSLVIVALAVPFMAFVSGGLSPATRPMLPVTPIAVVGWVLLIVATGTMAAFHRQRLLALALVGIIGLIVSATFIYLSAPDLALTQISVEVVTVVLLLMSLKFLPRMTVMEARPFVRGRDAGIAVLAGLAFGGLSYALMRRDFAFPGISDYMLANSYKLGGGDNVVNVILVDFRGYDTFGEITVLGIAGLTIFALARTLMSGRAAQALAAWRPWPGQAGDAHPILLRTATRVLTPLALLVGLYIFLRGHNAPGGGFIAGLVVSIALVMHYMASGPRWTQTRVPFSYQTLIALGVLIAGITGAGAWFAGLPFLTSAYGYVHLAGVAPVELATAMGFDLGVFLCVVGAVMLALQSLSELTLQAQQGAR